METKTIVIDGRMHIEGDDGLFRRVPLGMDEARLKEDYPIYRMEDGKPVKVEPHDMGNEDFAEAVASIPVNDSAVNDSGLEQ